MKALRIFTADGCSPCDELKSKLEAGKVIVLGVPNKVDIQLHDVASEEAFPLIAEFNLDEEPAAFLESLKCILSMEEDKVVIDCHPEEILD